MIERITIQGVASYSSTSVQELSNLKRINCLYGLNGSGKSTIAKYLQNPNALDYMSCSMTPTMTEGICVYNQKFVKDNFWDSKEQPGVFTVNEGNVEAERAIELAEKEITALESDCTQLKNDADNILKQKEAAQTSLEDKVWSEKDKFIKTPLEFCLERKLRKNLFLDAVKGADVADKEITIDGLRELATELETPDITPKQPLPLISFTGNSVESDTINVEIIVGSSESYLASLIEKIGHSDWVRDGLVHYENSEGVCPFCQETPAKSFEENLKDLFDETYKQKCIKLEENLKAYELAISTIEATLSNKALDDDYVTSSSEFALAKAELLSCLQKNLGLLKEKESKRSKPVELTSSTEYIDQLNQHINSINKKISDFNSRITNKQQIRDKIKKQFWQVHKRTYKSAIELVDDRLDELNKQVEERRVQYKQKKLSIIDQKSIIVAQRQNTTNVDTSIQNIRNTLTSIGVDDFHIDKVEGTEARYKIIRKDGTAENVYESLSEGEKTLITFLYFLEQCKGHQSPDSALDVADKIIVIDDPVSSLSHNFVYEIATLIQKEIIKKPFKQIFILTHNLFFFHEIMNLSRLKQEDFEESYALFRVRKNDGSKVLSIQKNDIRNEYDGYWQVIRDAHADIVCSSILPNAMRNIMEHFFSFVHKRDRLSDILTNLGDEHHNFRPLLRYIDRGSHSDMVNLTDFGDIDTHRFLRIFKEVFKRTDYEDHYNKMMK